MFYIGISAERERCSYVPDHNFWTVAQKLKYDSSLERGKLALKHTKKAKGNSKIASDPPPMALNLWNIKNSQNQQFFLVNLLEIIEFQVLANLYGIWGILWLKINF